MNWNSNVHNEAILDPLAQHCACLHCHDFSSRRIRAHALAWMTFRNELQPSVKPASALAVSWPRTTLQRKLQLSSDKRPQQRIKLPIFSQLCNSPWTQTTYERIKGLTSTQDLQEKRLAGYVLKLPFARQCEPATSLSTARRKLAHCLIKLLGAYKPNCS